MQLTHYTNKFTKRNFPIILVCDNVTSAANIGSLFRMADAFGIEKILLCGKDISLGRKMTKTSRATEKTVVFEILESASVVVNNLKKDGYQVFSLEITYTSVPLNTVSFSNEKPLALVIGDENYGVSENILVNSDQIIHIEMFGKNSSMNVVQATNIALYEITKQWYFKK